MNQNQLEIDKLSLEGRKILTMTGVQSVDGFSEHFLNLTVSDNKVKILGEKIKISSFNKTTGALTAEGVFSEIKYNFKKPPFVKRLFK